MDPGVDLLFCLGECEVEVSALGFGFNAARRFRAAIVSGYRLALRDLLPRP